MVAATNDTSELLPPDFPLTDATICKYMGSVASRAGARLGQKITLSDEQSRQLASAVRAVSIVQASGSASCPEDLGTATIIAFHSATPRHDIDLWWKTSGCQTLDNGTVRTNQLANPSFGQFQSAFTRIAKRK